MLHRTVERHFSIRIFWSWSYDCAYSRRKSSNVFTLIHQQQQQQQKSFYKHGWFACCFHSNDSGNSMSMVYMYLFVCYCKPYCYFMACALWYSIIGKLLHKYQLNHSQMAVDLVYEHWNFIMNSQFFNDSRKNHSSHTYSFSKQNSKVQI